MPTTSSPKRSFATAFSPQRQQEAEKKLCGAAEASQSAIASSSSSAAAGGAASSSSAAAGDVAKPFDYDLDAEIALAMESCRPFDEPSSAKD